MLRYRLYIILLSLSAGLWLAGCADKALSDEESRELAERFYQEGRRHMAQSRNDSALYCFAQAESLMDGGADAILQGKIYRAIGRLRGNNQEYDLAIDYYKKSLSASITANDHIGQAWSMINIGNNYLWKNVRDTNALLWYEKVNDLTGLNDTIRGELYANIGMYYLHNEVYDSAQVYLRRSIEPSCFHGGKSVRLLFLGRAYYLTNRLDSARHYLLQALEYPVGIRQQSGCYNMLHKVAVAKKDSARMLHYANLMNQCKDSIMQMEERMRNQIHAYDKVQYQTLNEEHDQQRQILPFVWFGIVVAMLCTGFWVWRNSRKHHEKVEQISSKNMELESKLQRISRQEDKLLDIKKQLEQQIEEKQNFLIEKRRTDWVARLKALSAEANELPFMGEAYKEYIISAYRKELHTDDWGYFSALFNEEFNGFASKVNGFYKRDLPQNRSSVMFCCLMLLEVPKQEIEILLNYTGVDTYKKRCQNFRRLFGLSSMTEFLPFLISLMLKSEHEIMKK